MKGEQCILIRTIYGPSRRRQLRYGTRDVLYAAASAYFTPKAPVYRSCSGLFPMTTLPDSYEYDIIVNVSDINKNEFIILDRHAPNI